MKMNSLCFMLRVNDIEPSAFFENIPEHKMVEFKEQVNNAKTVDDAQKIINEYKGK